MGQESEKQKKIKRLCSLVLRSGQKRRGGKIFIKGGRLLKMRSREAKSSLKSKSKGSESLQPPRSICQLGRKKGKYEKIFEKAECDVEMGGGRSGHMRKKKEPLKQGILGSLAENLKSVSGEGRRVYHRKRKVKGVTSMGGLTRSSRWVRS